MTVIAAALAAYFLMQGQQSADGSAIVTVNGENAQRIPLDRDGVYPLDGFDMELKVSDGKICVSHSDCPDKVCEKTGYIGSDGQTIVCLPNRVSVRISSNTDSDIDVILN